MTTKEAVCKRIILSIFSLLALCRTAGAQDSQKATLTAADAGTCAATSTACLVINVPSGSGGATFNIGANASANTVQFEATADYGTTWVALSVTPSSSTTTVTSTTSTGAWQANVAGYTKVRMRCSTFVGGMTTTYINLSTASARSNGGGGSVTHTAGNLTAFHIMIGNGAADATVDSACVTNGTGALSGCTSITTPGTVGANALTSTTSLVLGAGASACGVGTTSCVAGVEGAVACTPTAGQICKRLDSVTNNSVTSANGAAEVPDPIFSAVPTGSKCLQTSGAAGVIAEAAGACGTGAISGLTTGTLPKAASSTTLANSLCDEGITTANTLTCTNTAGIVATKFTSNGTTATFMDFAQGTTSAAVAPCNTANSTCRQAPAAVTSYVLSLAPAGPVNNNSAEIFSNANPGVGSFAKIPQTAFLTADYTNATTGFTSLTNLAFPVEASTNYHMHCNLIWSASAATAGPQYQITGPASPTAVVIQMNSAVTAATSASAAATAFSSALNPVGAIVTTATNEYSTLDMDLRNGANAGTVQVQAAAQGTGTLTERNASGCQLQ